MQYSKLISTTGALLSEFTAASLTAQRRLNEPTEYVATLGDGQGNVVVPGVTGQVYVTRQDPGCKQTVLRVPTHDKDMASLQAGQIVRVTYPNGKSTPPTVTVPHPIQNTPSQNPPKYPQQTPNVWPFYPLPQSAGYQSGNRASFVCDVFDSGFGGADVQGVNIRPMLENCAQVPCGYSLSTCTIRMMYDAYAGGTILFNPFDTTPQAGKGDADHFMYIVDAAGNKHYCQLIPAQANAGLIIFNFLQGNDTTSLVMKPLDVPIKLYAKAPTYNSLIGGSDQHGRIKVTEIACTYDMAIPGTTYQAPITFNFALSDYDWTGYQVEWGGDGSGYGRLIGTNMYFPHPVYIPGGRYTLEGWAGGYHGIGGPSVACWYGGSASFVLEDYRQVGWAEGAWHDAGYGTWRGFANIPDGLYKVGWGGATDVNLGRFSIY